MTEPSASPAEKRLEVLRASVLGTTLAEDVLRTLLDTEQPVLQTEAFARGATIVSHGETGGRFHIVVSGKAEARVPSERAGSVGVAVLAEGSCFGEVSLLTGEPASTEVVAVEQTETLTLDRDGFNALLAVHPELMRGFAQMVSRRLRAGDTAAGAAHERHRDLAHLIGGTRAERYGDLIGKQLGPRELWRRIEAAAADMAPLLIEGERGTGKELVARLVHLAGSRKEGPLFSTDCALVAETQWGDPLFGDYHRKQEGRPHPRGVCYIDLAEGGTILLKNIELLPRPVQDRLVRFVEKEDWSPGAHRRHDVRVVATCRDSLAEAERTGRVSPALAGLLSAGVISLPALRDRKRDIPELAAYFMRRHAQRLHKEVTRLDDQALTKLVSYHYRIANVQELEEAIERAVILTDDETIDAEEVFLGHPPESRSGGFNLLKLPGRFLAPVLRLYPKGVQALVAVVFALILYDCAVAAPPDRESLGTLLVWYLWWPLLVLSFFFLGRAWCAICPMSLAGTTAQRVRGLDQRIPGWLKSNDTYIAMAGFFAIVWAEEITHMRASPRATAVLLLAILVGALVVSVVFPRRTWCRHLCPLGGFASVCSASAIVELRPTTDICAAKCTGHACYKGSDRTPGCPMFNHVIFTQSNQHCVMCMDCVRTCPNGSPQLNLRVPGRELWGETGSRPELAAFVVMLGGLLVAQLLVQGLERSAPAAIGALLEGHRVAFLSALLGLSAGLPLVGLWLAARQRTRAGGPETQTALYRGATAWVPLVAAGFVAYQLGFLPGLAGLRATLAYGVVLPGPPALSATVPLLGLARIATMTGGLILTVLAVLQQGKGSAAAAGPHRGGVAILAAAAYWAGLLALMLKPEWLGL